MALTRIQRAVLAEARENIEYRLNTTLCGALLRVRDTATVTDRVQAADDLRKYFQDSLEGYINLEEWQIAKGFGYRSDRQLRQDRIEWINWALKGK